MQIQEEALELMIEVKDAATTPLENLDHVVETFYKTTVLSANKVVRNFLPPTVKQIQEILKTL